MQIRRMLITDLDFIYDSVCDLEDEMLDRELFSEIFKSNILNPAYLYLIAESDGVKTGFVTFHVQELLHHAGKVGEIQEFYIRHNFRQQGIGRALINEVFQFAEENGLKGIEVTSNRKRTDNVSVYKQLGFSLTHNKFTIDL